MANINDNYTFSADTGVISRLDDNPNESDLDAAGLKAAFDAGATNVVNQINDSLIPAINARCEEVASITPTTVGDLSNLETSNKTNIVAAINEVNTGLDDLVYTEVVSLASDMTIAANTQPPTQVYTLTPRTGYTPIIATTDNLYNGVVNLWYLNLNSTDKTISWRVRNLSNSQVSAITINVKVLYIKTASVS